MLFRESGIPGIAGLNGSPGEDYPISKNYKRFEYGILSKFSTEFLGVADWRRFDCGSCPGGRPGQPGAPGKQGKPGLLGQLGASGHHGIPGRSGNIGKTGDQGAIGLFGRNGISGQKGLNGIKGVNFF